MTRFLQDILREPEQLASILASLTGRGREDLESGAEIVRRSANVYIVGIGSSWHAGMAVRSILDAHQTPVYLADAAEMLYQMEIPSGSCAIVLSRSGKTFEIVSLLSKLKSANARIIAITNAPESPLAMGSSAAIMLNADFDHLVSVTMYSGLALAGGLLASASMGLLNDTLTADLGTSLASVQSHLTVWRQQIETSDWFTPESATYFLGRGGSMASAYEARLLWEEAAKAPASALPAGCFRHGPQETLRPGLRIGLWLDKTRIRAQDLALAAELRQHGAKLLLVGEEVRSEMADLALALPSIPSGWQFLADIIPLQLAAERLARVRGEDCDAFRICPYVIEDEAGLGGARQSEH